MGGSKDPENPLAPRKLKLSPPETAGSLVNGRTRAAAEPAPEGSPARPTSVPSSKKVRRDWIWILINEVRWRQHLTDRPIRQPLAVVVGCWPTDTHTFFLLAVRVFRRLVVVVSTCPPSSRRSWRCPNNLELCPITGHARVGPSCLSSQLPSIPPITDHRQRVRAREGP